MHKILDNIDILYEYQLIPYESYPLPVLVVLPYSAWKGEELASVAHR